MYYMRKPEVVERYQLNEDSVKAIRKSGRDIPIWLIDAFNNLEKKDGRSHFRHNDWIIYDINARASRVISDHDMKTKFSQISEL